jgi:outer membrane protein assembly factor BamB
MRRAYALFVGLVAASVALIALADDWPHMRGNIKGTGVADGKLGDQLEELWTYKAPEPAGFEATAVIANGVVYVGDTEGSYHAVKLSDGQPVWTKKFDGDGFTAGAMFDQGRLYVADMQGNARCLDAGSGEELWSAKLGDQVHAGPTVYGDSVFYTCESGMLWSLDTATGKERWQFQIDAPLRCSPTIADSKIMLAGCDSLLHAVNVSDGKEAFTVPIDGPTGATAAIATSATDGVRAYFGTEGGTFFAINVTAAEGQKPDVAWTYRDPRRGQPIRAAAAVTDSLVVFGGQGKAVFALDPTTGDEKWKLSTRSRVDSSPVIVGERVVAATTAGKVYLLETAKGEVKWEQDYGGGFNASPAVADGRVVLGNTDGSLYCFGSKELTMEGTENTENNK